MLAAEKTLMAGFGNTLLGDDGFGVEVIKRLEVSPLPAHIELLDVGIGGMHFVLRLMDGFARVIVVDALYGGHPPGSLYVYTADEIDLGGSESTSIEPHLTEPLQAMHLARALGVLPDKTILVGCEPVCCHVKTGLSAPVAAAVGWAVDCIRQLIGIGTDGR